MKPAMLNNEKGMQKALIWGVLCTESIFFMGFNLFLFLLLLFIQFALNKCSLISETKLHAMRLQLFVHPLIYPLSVSENAFQTLSVSSDK